MPFPPPPLNPFAASHYSQWRRLIVCMCGLSCLLCIALEEKLSRCAQVYHSKRVNISRQRLSFVSIAV